MKKKRVVITGIGLVSSLGNDIDEFWSALTSGKSGISEVSSFDTSNCNRHFGGEVKYFNADGVLSPAEKKVFKRASQFSIVATKNALRDAGLDERLHEFAKYIGVIIGTTFGEAQIVEAATQYLIESKDDLRQEFYLKQYRPDAISVNIAKKFGLCGPNQVIPTACAAGNYAIAYASSLIAGGRVPVMVAGGADPFSHVSFTGFSRLDMADLKCQPFDKNRKGMMVGEGAGIMILEDYDFAKKRNAKIYGEILGYGLSCDANHMTIPEVGGIVSVMEKALKNSNLKIKDIDYVCAHGTGTAINDKTESLAIRKVFYERGNEVPVSSIKSMLGHTMGAASALEAIAVVLAIKNDEIPPTINYETPDPECDIDCVPNKSRQKKINYALNNSFAFGGNNACVVLAKSDR